jgi:hypothetical protein
MLARNTRRHLFGIAYTRTRRCCHGGKQPLLDIGLAWSQRTGPVSAPTQICVRLAAQRRFAGRIRRLDGLDGATKWSN